MKKNISKIALRTDKIVSLSKNQVRNIVGGVPYTNVGKTCETACIANTGFC